MIANDYRRFNYTPYAYRTKNYGKTWERIVDENDVQSYTLAIVEDLEEPNLLFLGTDDGLYISINAGKDWTKWTEGFPTTSVKDLVIHPREHDLVIGTFGRAAWVLDDIRPLRAMAKNQNLMSSAIHIFEPPIAYQAAYQQPTGSRFGADALYQGENREGGARFRYLFNKKSEDTSQNKDAKNTDTKKVAWDSLTLKIYDGARLIRTLSRKVPKDNGIHSWTWYMDEAGADRPSRSLRTSNRESGGVQVKPGTYKAVLHYGDLTSETMITVASDPRLQVSQKNIDEVYAASKALENMQQTAADAVKQLAESKAIAETYVGSLSKLDKKAYQNEIDLSKNIVKQIDSLMDQYLGKVDDRQGITRNSEVTPLQRLRVASGYVNGSQNGLTETETRLMNQAKTALNGVLAETNAFYMKDWPEYEAKMKAVQTNPFKDVKQFRLD